MTAPQYFYNAGVDPYARDLSPGVLMSALAIGDAIAAGRRRFDYLRGDEAYKYEWGAVTRRSAACSWCEPPDVGSPHPSEPCFDSVDRPPLPGGRARIVEVMATGTTAAPRSTSTRCSRGLTEPV